MLWHDVLRTNLIYVTIYELGISLVVSTNITQVNAIKLLKHNHLITSKTRDVLKKNLMNNNK